MTIIDEKGRLFGWINIVDLFVIVLIAVLVFMSVRFFTQKRISVEEKDFYIVKVRATNLGPEIAETIQKGLPIQRPDGTNFGTVISDPEVGPTQVYVTTPQGMLVPRAQPKMMDATFSFLCSVPQGSPEIKYGSQSLKAGATGFIESNLTKYTIHILSIRPITFDEAQELLQPTQESTIPDHTQTQETTTSEQSKDTNP
jgi:hypothetical protein